MPLEIDWTAWGRTGLRVALILAVFAALIYLGQNRLIFFPFQLNGPPAFPEVPGRSWTNVTFQAADGTALHGVWFGQNGSPSPVAEAGSSPETRARNASPSSDARFVLLYSHGNAGHLGFRFPRMRGLASLPIDIFIYDYRGFGLSSGSPSVAGVFQDGEAALAWLVNERKVPLDRVILYGESVGSGIAAALAAPRLGQFAGLVIESGFGALSWQAGRRFPVIGPWVLVQDMPNVQTVSLYKGPFFIIHSKADGVIPYADGEALFAACPSSRKTFLRLDGIGHNDPVWELPEYQTAWIDFLEVLRADHQERFGK